MFYSISTFQENQEAPAQEEPKQEQPPEEKTAQPEEKREKRKMSLEQVSKELKEIERRFTQRKKSSTNEPLAPQDPPAELPDEGTQCFVLEFGEEGATSYTEREREAPSVKKSGKAAVGWGDLEVKW